MQAPPDACQPFLSPFGDNRGEVERQVRLVLSDLLDHLSRSAELPVLPAGPRGEPLGPLLREEPSSFEELRRSVARVLRGSMNPYAPRYMGHMDSMPTVYSVVGDLLASALNNNLFALEMSPFLTRLEDQLVRELCALFGLPRGAAGLVLAGGSLANLQALCVARNALLRDRSGDVRAARRPLAVLASEHAHVSVRKAAMILGLGRDALVEVPADRDGRLDVDALEAAVRRTRAEGRRPSIVVATAGTTVTGTIDPLTAVGEVARREGMWLHVDAIWGGGLVFSERERGRLAGIEAADSVSFNPQKWMMVAKTCSLAMFRRGSDLEEHFRVPKTYVRGQDWIVDLSELGIHGTKRGDVLKLWLSLQTLGTRGYARFVERTMRLALAFEERAARRDYLVLAPGRDTALVCMRGEPRGLSASELDAWNGELQAHLVSEKRTFFSLPRHRGADWLRILFLNPYLDEEILDEVLADVDAFERPKRGG